MEEKEDAPYCYQDRNSSCRKTSMSPYTYITLYIFFALISVVTVFLNLVVIISISHFKHLQTPSNLLILSLAVSDLLVGLIVIPAMTVAIIEPCWVLGEYFCALLLYILFLSSTTSLGSLILISIDRYVAVSDPLMYCLKITTTRTFCFISVVWCFCFIYAAFFVHIQVNVQVPSRCFVECFVLKKRLWENIVGVFILVLAPCSIIITIYLKIFVVARSQARKIFSIQAATVSGFTNVQSIRSERKATKTLGIVVLNYLISWNPLTNAICIIFSSNIASSFIITSLPLVNSFINPIIYAFFYPWFKVTAKRILTLRLRHL